MSMQLCDVINLRINQYEKPIHAYAYYYERENRISVNV